MDIEQQYDKLLRYCTMKLHHTALAEDITQEAFLRFWESRDRRPGGREMAYLYTIARNLCTDYFRKHREVLWEDLPPQAEEKFSAADSAAGVVDRLSIETALATLTDQAREAVVLRYGAELSVTEVGEVMGLSRFAVRRRLTEAMKGLRKELADHEE